MAGNATACSDAAQRAVRADLALLSRLPDIAPNPCNHTCISPQLLHATWKPLPACGMWGRGSQGKPLLLCMAEILLCQCLCSWGNTDGCHSANVLESIAQVGDYLSITQMSLDRSSQLRTCSKTSFIHPHGLNVPPCFRGFSGSSETPRGVSAPCAPAPGCWALLPASWGPNGLSPAQLICHC